MKLLNILKKRTKDSIKSTVQSLDKKQLEKVIGGTELINDGGVNTGAHKRPGVL